MAERVMPPGLAAPTGPWSPAVKVGNLLFIAGCVALDENNQIVGAGDIAAQTHQVMKNFLAVVEEAGMKMSDVVKITNYITDTRLYSDMAKVRVQYLQAPYPASTMVEVSALLYPGLLIEIEGIAVGS